MPSLARIGVGPAKSAINPGHTFNAQASDTWKVGEEMTTWSGLKVKVIKRWETNNPFSWKYGYTFEVIE